MPKLSGLSIYGNTYDPPVAVFSCCMEDKLFSSVHDFVSDNGWMGMHLAGLKSAAECVKHWELIEPYLKQG